MLYLDLNNLIIYYIFIKFYKNIYTIFDVRLNWLYFYLIYYNIWIKWFFFKIIIKKNIKKLIILKS